MPARLALIDVGSGWLQLYRYHVSIHPSVQTRDGPPSRVRALHLRPG
jgi:hypothetical protein